MGGVANIWIVTGGQAPDIAAITGPGIRIGDAVLPLGERGTPGILEIGTAVTGHVRVSDIAEINPAVRILIPEQRWKRDVGLAIIGGPGISAGPIAPG